MRAETSFDPLAGARALVATPLRHRLVVRLDAPPAEVWRLVGDHARLPEYSSGIERVHVEKEGTADVRVCAFRPMEGAEVGLVLRERVVAYVEGAGYSTAAEPGNPFGLENDLSLITVEPTPGGGSLFRWEQHYDHPDLPFARASFDEGLADIAANLVRRFGGEVLERYVDGPR